MSTPQPPMPQQSAPAPGGWQAPQGSSYTSPIPITRTHLGHALASEWTKIKSVRSTVWTLGVFLVLVFSSSLLIASQMRDEDFVDLPYSFSAFIGLMLGQICLITLGVLVVSSEYGTGMIRTTFTASPQRHRVLTAKFLIFFALAFGVSFASVFLMGALTAGMHSGASDVPWVGSAFKGSLYVSLLGVLSLAVGSILRHSAGAITAMMGVVLLPAILPAFLLISESTRKVGEKILDYNAINSLAKIFGADSEGGGTSQLVLLLVVTAAAVAGAFALLEKRDV
ncbi:ABC transporter permease [Streptomyces sp. NPDC059785]|uniref:ABC transporter permease n=1 Tax=Streptomyces sp. NPDC059785 TaxID=3346945 RepID=UPI00365EFF9F